MSHCSCVETQPVIVSCYRSANLGWRYSDSNTVTSGVERDLWLAMLALQKRVLHNLGIWKRAANPGKDKKDYTAQPGCAVPGYHFHMLYGSMQAWVRLRGQATTASPAVKTDNTLVSLAYII